MFKFIAIQSSDIFTYSAAEASQRRNEMNDHWLSLVISYSLHNSRRQDSRLIDTSFPCRSIVCASVVGKTVASIADESEEI